MAQESRVSRSCPQAAEAPARRLDRIDSLRAGDDGRCLCAGIDAFGFDWLEGGALNGAIPATHEWWRVVTALTLHADVGHLLSNLAFGAVFGFLASRALGGRRRVGQYSCFGAMMGNGLDAMVMPTEQRSLGASTAVFAALGILSALHGHSKQRTTCAGRNGSAP